MKLSLIAFVALMLSASKRTGCGNTAKRAPQLPHPRQKEKG